MKTSSWLAALVFLALSARVAAALVVGEGFHFPDEAAYVDAAGKLSGGQGFDPGYNRVPGYPVFLALLSSGLPISVTMLRVGQAAMAALGTVLVFQLADRIFGRGPAAAAGFTYALDPLLVISASLFYPEAIAALLMTAAVYAALQGSSRDSVTRSATAGAILGILALFRPVALVLPPIVAGWLALTVCARPTRRMTHLAAFGLAFLLVLTPWTMRNLRVHGSVLPGMTAGSETAPVRQDEIKRRGFIPSLIRWAWTNPGDLVWRTTRQFGHFWEFTPTRMATDDAAQRQEFHRADPRLSTEPIFSRGLRDWVSAVTFALELGLAIAGILVALRTRRREVLLLLALILAYAVGYAIFAAKLRYRIPVLPLVFLFTGVGAAALYSLMRGGGHVPRSGSV